MCETSFSDATETTYVHTGQYVDNIFKFIPFRKGSFDTITVCQLFFKFWSVGKRQQKGVWFCSLAQCSVCQLGMDHDRTTLSVYVKSKQTSCQQF